MNTGKMIIVVGIVVLLTIIGVVYFMFFNTDNLTSSIDFNDNVASVNGVAISKSTFDSQLAISVASFASQGVDVGNNETLLQIKTQVLSDLIDNELLKQEITKSNIEISKENIDNEINILLEQAGSQEAFDKQLVDANITIEDLRVNISRQLSTQAFLLQNVDLSSVIISDEEAEAFYDAGKVAQPDLPPFEEVKDLVVEQLLTNKRQALLNEFMISLREKADIETTSLE